MPSHASLRGAQRRGSPVFGLFARRALFFLDCFALLAMTRFKREACSPVASLKSARDFIETTGLPTLRFGLSRKICRSVPSHASLRDAQRRGSPVFGLFARRALFFLDCFALLAMTRFKREACSPVASLKSARDFIETTGLPTLRFGLSRKNLPVYALTCVTARRAASWQSRRTLVGQRICTARLDCFALLAMTRFKCEACSPVASLKSVRVFY